MNNLSILAVLAFLNFPNLTQAMTFENKFPELAPSVPGCPLNKTFFRRASANAPVFLQVTESGSPLSLNFSVRLYPEELPEKPKKEAFPTKEAYKKAQSTYIQALRKIYESDDTSPQVGLISFSYEMSHDTENSALNLCLFNIMPAYRNKGYGTHALLTALSALKSREKTPFSHFKLGVMEGPFQERLIKLYERVGFSKVEEYDFMATAFGRTQQTMQMVRSDFNPHKPGIFQDKT